MTAAMLTVIVVGILALAVARTFVRARRAAVSRGATNLPLGSSGTGESIVLRGRTFRVMGDEGSVAWDGYMIREFTRVGLIPLPEMKSTESAGEYALRLLEQLGADVGPVMGGLLVPAAIRDFEWTPEIAAATSAHVLGCYAPVDRSKIQNLTLSVLFDFFAGGIASSLVSLASSSTTTEEDGPSTTPIGAAHGAASFAS